MVVGSSSVEAVKFGGATPNELGSPVTMTGAPTVEFVKSNAPVLTRYWPGAAPVPTKSKAATARPPRYTRLRFRAPNPSAVTRPDAAVVPRRTRPALASRVVLPGDGLVATPKASMLEPTDIGCGLLACAPCPN